MAARWIGLAPKDKPQRRKRGFVHGLLHSLGAGSVLMLAATMNFAMYPDAIASVMGIDHSPLGLMDTQQANAADPKANLPVDPNELHLLAATAWGEARSEGEDGMRAVAHVIVNRVGARFGDDLETVIRAPKQFSAWNLGDPNRPLVQNPERYATAGADKETWEEAQEVAREVLSGQSVDPTNGALFYHTRVIHPWWSRYGQGRTVIGAHVFYRDVPQAPRAARRAPSVTHVAVRRGGRVRGVITHSQPLPAPTTVSIPAPPLNPADIDGDANT